MTGSQWREVFGITEENETYMRGHGRGVRVLMGIVAICVIALVAWGGHNY